jgi:mannosyltransferase OCH1-like enzyme
MRVNNFKELEREEIKNLDPAIKKIKSNVNSNLGIFQFIGEMVELFLPKVFTMFIHLSSNKDSVDDKDRKYPNTNDYPNR